MKIKAKVEPQIRFTLRVPASLKNQIDTTAKLADDRGLDYFGTLVDVIAKFNNDMIAELTKAGDKSGDKVGVKAGDRNGAGAGSVRDGSL